jgi:hypothetical protein
MRICCFLLLASFAVASPVIDQKDREILEPYFNALVTHQELGYVLLGEKPAILLGYVHHLSWKHPLYSLGSSHYFYKGNQLQKKAWEIWKKYSPQISDRFLVTEEVNPSSPLCANVFVIHRDLFCEVVNENREIFENILGRKITGEALYEQAKQTPLFSVLLKGNEALLGIILGYGKTNSMLFSQRKMNDLGLFPKEADKIASICLPTFRANWDDPETIQLREKYLAGRKKIKTIFLDHNAFDQILKILFEDKAT